MSDPNLAGPMPWLIGGIVALLLMHPRGWILARRVTSDAGRDPVRNLNAGSAPGCDGGDLRVAFIFGRR